jgi:3-oxoadipate enol-lactonase
MKARVGDIEVHYEVSGEGAAPLVLVHGIGSDLGSFATLQSGLPAVRTFAYDVRGHGQTSLGQPEGTLDQLGSDLAGFLEAVTGPADCLGFSLGGTVVLWAAARRRQLVRSVIAVATSSVVGRAAAAWYRDRASAPDAGPGYRNAATAMAGLNEKPLQPLLADVTCPVLVIGGENDEFCPPRAAQIMLEALPQARYVEFPNVGHLVLSEAPDELRDSVASFLAQVPAS